MRKNDTNALVSLISVVQDLDGPSPGLLEGREQAAQSSAAEEALSVLLSLDGGEADGLARHALFCLGRMAFETASSGERLQAVRQVRAPFLGSGWLGPEGEPEDPDGARDVVLYERALALQRQMLARPGHSEGVRDERSWLWRAVFGGGLWAARCRPAPRRLPHGLLLGEEGTGRRSLAVQAARGRGQAWAELLPPDPLAKLTQVMQDQPFGSLVAVDLHRWSPEEQRALVRGVEGTGWSVLGLVAGASPGASGPSLEPMLRATLSENPVELLPIRSRASDWPSLVRWALAQVAPERLPREGEGARVSELVEALAIRASELEYSWPGNLVEVRSYVAAALCQAHWKPLESAPSSSHPSWLDEALTGSMEADEVKQAYIRYVYTTKGESKSKVARSLGLSRTTLNRWLED